MKRQLILEDGSCYIGEGFGGNHFQIGEIVFTTGMDGYQEVISDSSFFGQIITMSYPMIGNYGINRDDFESIDPVIFGLVVGEYCEYPANFRSTQTLDEYLKTKNIPGIAGIDTRALVKKIRAQGTMRAVMVDGDVDVEEIVVKLKNTPYRTDQVVQVSTKRPYMIPSRGKKVVLVDFGVKQGIVRELSKRGCDITVLPYNCTSREILDIDPDGILLSNGPGNPKDVPEAILMIQALIGKKPIFGICLGHQLVSLACGANTVKLKFGHRGCNHPVIDLTTNKVMITSQNHSYAVEAASLQGTGLVESHRALNDQSVEGVKHEKYPVFSVQFHPESSPGPEDANYLFDTFMEMMKGNEENA